MWRSLLVDWQKLLDSTAPQSLLKQNTQIVRRRCKSNATIQEIYSLILRFLPQTFNLSIEAFMVVRRVLLTFGGTLGVRILQHHISLPQSAKGNGEV